MKFLISILILFANTAFAADCGGINEDVFKNVSLSLHVLHDDNVFEEGLSFYEYPDFGIELEADGYDLTIGMAGFSGTEIELVCVDGYYQLKALYEGGQTGTIVKDFVYESGKVVVAKVYDVNDGKLSPLADFNEKGQPVVYGHSDYFKPSGEVNVLSSYLDEDSNLDISVGTYGDYEISIGDLEIYTFKDNELEASAILVDNVLYVEVLKMNMIIEITFDEINYGEFERATVKAGSIDSASALINVGKFMGYADFISLKD